MYRSVFSFLLLVFTLSSSYAKAPQESIHMPAGPVIYPQSSSLSFASEQPGNCHSVPIRPKVIVQVPQPEIIIEEDVPTHRGKLKGGRPYLQTASNVYTVSNLQPIGLGFGVQGPLPHGLHGLGLQPLGFQSFGFGVGIHNQDFSELRILHELNALSSQLAVQKAHSERAQLLQKYSHNVLKGLQHSTQTESDAKYGNSQPDSVTSQFQAISKRLDDLSTRLEKLESQKKHDSLEAIKAMLEQMSKTLEAIKAK